MFEDVMKIEIAGAAPLLLLVLCGTSTWAQGVIGAEPQKSADTNAIRVIRDPHTAMRWLLKRDPTRPSGPGRMVLLGQQEVTEPQCASVTQGNVETYQKIPNPVIRNGDRLVVEENTAVVTARLAAIALGSAIEGTGLRVRLLIGGKVVRAVAIGPGRAAFAASAGRPR
jgi:hypothetical protein